MNLVKYRTGTSNTVISSKFNFGFGTGTGSGSLLDIGLFRLSVPVPVLVLFPDRHRGFLWLMSFAQPGIT